LAGNTHKPPRVRTKRDGESVPYNRIAHIIKDGLLPEGCLNVLPVAKHITSPMVTHHDGFAVTSCSRRECITLPKATLLLPENRLTLFLWLKKAQRKSFAKRKAVIKGYHP